MNFVQYLSRRCINKSKKYIFLHIEATVTSNFDPFTPKVNAFIVVPKYIKDESGEIQCSNFHVNKANKCILQHTGAHCDNL